MNVEVIAAQHLVAECQYHPSQQPEAEYKGSLGRVALSSPTSPILAADGMLQQIHHALPIANTWHVFVYTQQ